MAIVQNMWLKKSKKRLGGTVLYQAMEQTRQRELAVSVSNPRTPSQMRQRVKWANLVNFYRVNRSWMKYAFETKTPQQSEYNKFMSVNVSSSNIYLTKTLAGMGACVVAPYIVTQGSLFPIETTKVTGAWTTNINLTEGFTLDNSTTIADFASALLAVNPALREGDQLSFIRFSQQVNSDTGTPYMVVRRYEILLNSTSGALVKDFFPLDYIQVTATQSLPVLSVHDSGLAGGFALILSRTIGGKTFVSTQRVIVANNSATINAYSSTSALNNAIASYGEGDDAFLSSNTAEGAQSVPLPVSVLSVGKGSTILVPGTEVSVTPWRGGDTLNVHFNQPIEASTYTGIVVLSDNVQYTCAAAITSGDVVLTLPQNFPTSSTKYLKQISVTIDESVYNATFNIPDPGQVGGDE